MDFPSLARFPCICGANAVANADVITAVRGELSVLQRATEEKVGKWALLPWKNRETW